MFRVVFRRDTEEIWNDINPVLAEGELGYDTTHNQFKVGDGSTEWQDLSYVGAGAYTGGFGIGIDSDVISLDIEAGENLEFDNETLNCTVEVPDYNAGDGINIDNEIISVNESYLNDNLSFADEVHTHSFDSLDGSPSDVITAGDNLVWDGDTIHVVGIGEEGVEYSAGEGLLLDEVENEFSVDMAYLEDNLDIEGLPEGFETKLRMGAM